MLLSDVRTHAERLRSSFQEASERDHAIATSLQEKLSQGDKGDADGGRGLRLLAKTKVELLELLPPEPLLDLMNDGHPSDIVDSPEVVALELALQQLVSLVKTRSSAIEKLETFSKSEFAVLLLNPEDNSISSSTAGTGIGGVFKEIQPQADELFIRATKGPLESLQKCEERQEELLEEMMQVSLTLKTLNLKFLYILSQLSVISVILVISVSVVWCIEKQALIFFFFYYTLYILSITYNHYTKSNLFKNI